MSIVAGSIISGVGSLIGGIFGASSASRKARAAAREKARLESKLQNLEDNRQPIINPYEDVKSVAGLAEDLTSQISNPYANLGVATQAAEMQAEEADIALANTLDTIRATGAGAGGATALAQAALRSKKDVAANIESQEANNEKLRAQGEQALQQQKIAEQRRIQGIDISEAQRVQQLEAAGKQFEFGAREQRELTELDRISAQLSGAEARKGQAESERTGAITGTIGGLVSSIGGLFK